MRRRVDLRPAAALAAVLLLCAAAPAEAQTRGTYPASRSNADVAAWLRRDTPLDPAKVVDISPSSITEITSYEATQEPVGFVAILHAEALDLAIESEEGILSWAIAVELDCPGRRVRLGPMTGFPGRDIRYGPKPIRGGDDDWVAPSPKAPLDNVLRALCDQDFRRPLADTQVVAAAPAPPRAAPAQASARPKPQAVTVAANVQVGASPSLPDAKGILAKVQRKFAGDLQGFQAGVVTVTLDQKTVYRVVISGFRSGSEANRLCETLKAGGQACFVRG